MMHELRMYVFPDVRLGLVLGRHPKINLFGLHYCVICCEVETKLCIVGSARKYVLISVIVL